MLHLLHSGRVALRHAGLVTLAGVLVACGAGAPVEDDSDLVEPLVSPAGSSLDDLVEPLREPGSGTITISAVRNGTYTSPRDNPVDVESVDEATITFVLEPQDHESFTTVDGSVTWSYSLLATESDEHCTVVEEAEGEGTFAIGESGPTVNLGMDSEFNLDSNAYLLTVAGSPEDDTEEDPSTHYRVGSTICSEDMPLEEEGLDWWPYIVRGELVSGRLVEGSATLSGSSQETVPAMSGEGPPTIVTITWEIRLP